MPKSVSVVDFGFEPEQSPYHFAVKISSASGRVAVEERFVCKENNQEEVESLPVMKAALDAYRWSRIAETAAYAFNQRLRSQELRSTRWKKRETLLAPHFGKELVLLIWAVEDADATLIPNMAANWLGLAPEERWWLYTTIDATSGHPEHGKDRGWRKAIKIAFAENPTSTSSPAAFLSEQLPQAPRRKQKKDAEEQEQPMLFGTET